MNSVDVRVEAKPMVATATVMEASAVTSVHFLEAFSKIRKVFVSAPRLLSIGGTSLSAVSPDQILMSRRLAEAA